jgi:hypothetical protein
VKRVIGLAGMAPQQASRTGVVRLRDLETAITPLGMQVRPTPFNGTSDFVLRLAGSTGSQVVVGRLH